MHARFLCFALIMPPMYSYALTRWTPCRTDFICYFTSMNASAMHVHVYANQLSMQGYLASRTGCII